MVRNEMHSGYQESSPTRDQWLRLHTAVRPVDDSHPVQGWELGEYVALMKMLWDKNHATMAQYTYMYIMCCLRSSRRSVFCHIEDGCSHCLDGMLLLVTLLGLPTETSVRVSRTCINCQKGSPFAALFCVWCGDRIKDLHLPFSMRRARRLTNQ